MRRNLASSLRCRSRAAPMAAHDRLPPALRDWAATAALPWSAASLLRLWHRALRETGCETRARARLDAAEARLLARDAARIWGPGHPATLNMQKPPSPGASHGAFT